MKPLELILSAFGSYGGTERVDFEKMRLTDFEQARNCYNTILNNYGDSDYANDARTYLSQIESRISEGE